jgi:hypothetical protein
MNLLEAVRTHTPSALHPMILEYADDSLDKFIDARDMQLRLVHLNNWLYQNPSPLPFQAHRGVDKIFDYLQNVQNGHWQEYCRKHRKTCALWDECGRMTYKAVKHKMPLVCVCAGLLPMWMCRVRMCTVCGPAQFIQRS